MHKRLDWSAFALLVDEESGRWGQDFPAFVALSARKDYPPVRVPDLQLPPGRVERLLLLVRFYPIQHDLLRVHPSSAPQILLGFLLLQRDPLGAVEVRVRFLPVKVVQLILRVRDVLFCKAPKRPLVFLMVAPEHGLEEHIEAVFHLEAFSSE